MTHITYHPLPTATVTALRGGGPTPTACRPSAAPRTVLACLVVIVWATSPKALKY